MQNTRNNIALPHYYYPIIIEYPASGLKGKLQKVCIEENMEYNSRTILNNKKSIETLYENIRRKIQIAYKFTSSRISERKNSCDENNPDLLLIRKRVDKIKSSSPYKFDLKPILKICQM